MHHRIRPIKDWHRACLDQLHAGQTPDCVQILTPNLRLARFLQTYWSDASYPALDNQPQHAWLRPNILPLAQWLQHCWKDNHMQWLTTSTPKTEETYPRLLNNQQISQLWHQVLTEDTEGSVTVSQTAHLIHKVQEAYEHVQAFNLNPRDFDEIQPEIRQFKHWYARFEQACSEHQWLCPAKLPSVLWTPAFQTPSLQNSIAVPTYLGFFGFQQFTPQLTQLKQRLTSLGTAISELDLAPQDSAPRQFHCYETQDQEIRAAIAWAKQQSDAQTAKDLTIAIIVPNLKQRLSEIKAITTRAFNANARVFPQDMSHLKQVNISASLALSSYPLASQSLNLLKWLVHPISQTEFFNNLQSPYARFSDILPQALSLRTRLNALRSKPAWLNHWDKQLKHHHICSSRLDQLLTQDCKPNQSTTPIAWRQWAFKVLEHLGWPGEHALDSHEYQVWQRWVQALNEFPEVVLFTNETHTSAHWLSLFEHVLNQIQFQPQALSNRINILGSLEAAGQAFDAIWLTGMDDQTWPAKQASNPFIPKVVQISHKLPHSSAAHELEFAQTYLAQLIQAAPSVTFSCSQWIEDKTVQPSRLGLNLVKRINAQSEPSVSSASESDPEYPIDYQAIQDNQGIPLAINPQEAYSLAGGVYHFKTMRQCPFQAYARYRLGLRQIQQPNLWSLTPIEQGLIIHAVMEQAGKCIRDHAQLNTMALNQLSDLARAWVTDVMDTQIGQDASLLSPIYLKLEAERILKLVLSWLELEKKRTPFRIMGVESEHPFKIGSFCIKGRIDRIDQLETGEIVLLDYKTGQVQLSDLNPDHLVDPQLPIYYLFAVPEAKGIAFGKISAPKVEIMSLTSEGMDILDTGKTSKQYLDHTTDEKWRAFILSISEQIASAAAHTAPLHKATTCDRCDYAGLCRIQKHAISE